MQIIPQIILTVNARDREHKGLRRIGGYGMSVSRGAASAMMFTYSSLLVTMCRNMITVLRDTFLRLYIPFDAATEMHKIIAILALISTGMLNYHPYGVSVTLSVELWRGIPTNKAFLVVPWIFLKCFWLFSFILPMAHSCYFRRQSITVKIDCFHAICFTLTVIWNSIKMITVQKQWRVRVLRRCASQAWTRINCAKDLAILMVLKTYILNSSKHPLVFLCAPLR